MELLSPTADRAFRRSLVRIAAVSALVHGVVLAGVVTYAMKTQEPLIKGPIYTVNLVEIPVGTKAAAMGLAPPVRKTMPALSRKALEVPPARELTLPSKAKLKRPPPIKSLGRSGGPAPRSKAAPEKTRVAVTGAKASARAASVTLEATTFPFSYYVRALGQKIDAAWEPVVHGMLSREAMQVVVGFRILRDGSIRQPVVEQSSGLSFFDQSALRAVRQAAPLPPLPEAFPEDNLVIHIKFHYRPEG